MKLNNSNWDLALSDANSYKGAQVNLVGKVFLSPEAGADFTAFQMYTSKDTSDGNTIVVAPSGVKIGRNDYVRVEGTLYDEFEGTNAFGAKLRAPRVRAEKAEVISREDAIAPAVKAYSVGLPISQHQLTATLDRVELAERETRFYVHVQNQSPDNATVSTYGVKLVQGTRQMEPKSMYDSGYPSLPSDMLTGVEASTVLVFDSVVASPMRLVWDSPHTSNYSMKFQPYQWSLDDVGQWHVGTPESTDPGRASVAAGISAVSPTSPTSVVSQFYSLLNAKNLQAAWNLQSPKRQSTLTYADWSAGYANTRAIQASGVTTTAQNGTTASVSMNIASTDGSGPATVAKRFRGTWDLVLVNGSWKLDNATISEIK